MADTQAKLVALPGWVLVLALLVAAQSPDVRAQDARDDVPEVAQQPQDQPTQDEPAAQTRPQTQPESEPQTQPARPADLPDAQTIIDHAIEAVGGKDAVESIKSLSMKATLATDRGDVELELYSANPDKVFMRRRDGRGELTLGSDGQIGWLKPVDGNLQLLDESQTDHVRRQANVYRILIKLREDYRDFQTVDRLVFDDAESLKVKMVDHRGRTQFAIFDIESRLIKALQIPEDSPEGERLVTVRFSEWKKHGEILGFTQARIDDDSPGNVSVLTIKEVEFNNVDAAMFAVPAEAKAMAAKKAADATLPATQPQLPDDDSEEGEEEDDGAGIDEDEDEDGDEVEDEDEDEDEEDPDGQQSDDHEDDLEADEDER